MVCSKQITNNSICPIMYLRYVQHGLWLKAHVKYSFSLFFSSLMFLYLVYGTLFLRKGRGVGKNVCGMVSVFFYYF